MRRLVKSVFYVILTFIIFSLVFSLLGVFISYSPDIERASKSFEYRFGIKLELVGIEKWNPQSRDPYDLIRELRAKVSLNDADIVIGFSGRRENFTGLATPGGNGSLGNYIITSPFISRVIPEKVTILCRVFNSYHVQSYVLVHEIGHIFRAVHPQNHFVFSVMNPKTLLFTTHFDEHNRQIIFQNKYLPK